MDILNGDLDPKVLSTHLPVSWQYMTQNVTNIYLEADANQGKAVRQIEHVDACDWCEWTASRSKLELSAPVYTWPSPADEVADPEAQRCLRH